MMMGLARDLSMGKRRQNPHSANTGAYAKLRRLMNNPAPDLARFKAVLEEIGGQRERMRLAEGMLYTEGCKRYAELSGEQFGPTQGTY